MAAAKSLSITVIAVATKEKLIMVHAKCLAASELQGLEMAAAKCSTVA